MDLKPKVPEIRADVNREPEHKKKAGLLGFLRGWGAGGTGGAGGAGGGAGGWGGAGAAASGGIFAAKTGLLALVLTGTTVAGLVGVGAYKLFGPGPSDQLGGSLQLFKSRPAGADASSDPALRAGPDGQSASLNKLAEGNPAQPVPAAAGLADQTAANAASARVSDSVGGASGPINALSGSGPRLGAFTGFNKSLGKQGFSMGAPSGGAGSSARVANTGDSSDAGARASSGKVSAFAGGARPSAAGSRASSPRRLGGAARDLFGARSDLRGGKAPSFQAADRTFQNANAPIGSAGPEAGAPGTGPGVSQSAQAKNLPVNPTANPNQQQQGLPAPPAKNVTPWQSAITTASVLLGLGGLLIFLVGKLPTVGMRYIVAGLVGVLGAMVIALGAQIAGGQYGQTLQGGVLAAAGAGLIAASVMAVMDTSEQVGKGNDVLKGKPGAKPFDWSSKMEDVDKAINPPAEGATATADAKKAPGFFDGVNPYVWLGGGAALIGIAAANLVPPKTRPSTEFENGRAPDANWFGYDDYPSAKALERFV